MVAQFALKGGGVFALFGHYPFLQTLLMHVLQCAAAFAWLEKEMATGFLFEADPALLDLDDVFLGGEVQIRFLIFFVMHYQISNIWVHYKHGFT